MRTKNFVLGLVGLVAFSLVFVIFRQQQPESLQNFVSTTHKQIRDFQDTLRDAETKSFITDEKYLSGLGFVDHPRLYPQDVWRNTSLPVIVTYVMEGMESQAVGLINNVAKLMPNNTILVYNLGLGNYGFKTLLNYCNSSRCQILTFALNEYPSHVQDETLHAYRPIIIQDALYKTGAVLFMESDKRLLSNVTLEMVNNMLGNITSSTGIITWPMMVKNAVSSLTHKKMFEYFHTDTDNFLFLPMVSADVLLIVNKKEVHTTIMLPWVQCALTHDCIVPIGAQSGGCRYDKKPQYRYSGCHNYDTSALNIILGLQFNLDHMKYTYHNGGWVYAVPLEKAVETLRGIEMNATTDEARTNVIVS